MHHDRNGVDEEFVNQIIDIACEATGYPPLIYVPFTTRVVCELGSAQEIEELIQWQLDFITDLALLRMRFASRATIPLVAKPERDLINAVLSTVEQQADFALLELFDTLQRLNM